jgi:hypothetical protein
MFRESRTQCQLRDVEISRPASDGREPRVDLERLRFLEVDAMLTRPEKPSRNHIELKDIKRWSKHLDATPDQLQEVIEKVGNAVATVKRELKNLAAKG